MTRPVGGEAPAPPGTAAFAVREGPSFGDHDLCEITVPRKDSLIHCATELHFYSTAG